MELIEKPIYFRGETEVLQGLKQRTEATIEMAGHLATFLGRCDDRALYYQFGSTKSSSETQLQELVFLLFASGNIRRRIVIVSFLGQAYNCGINPLLGYFEFLHLPQTDCVLPPTWTGDPGAVLLESYASAKLSSYVRHFMANNRDRLGSDGIANLLSTIEQSKIHYRHGK